LSRNVNFKIPTIIAVCIGIALFLSLVSALDWLEFAELHVLRSAMLIQAKYSPKETSPELALIRIDRESERMLGTLPWSYEILMPLCKILKKSEANAVGLFAQFDRPKNITDCDNLFTAHHPQSTSLTHIELYPEDGIYKAKLLDQGRYSLELMLVCHYLGVDINQLDNRIHRRKSFRFGRYLLIEPPDTKSLRIPVDKEGQMLINFAAKSRLPDMASFVDVLNADNAVKDGPSVVDLQKYNGKIVLIGAKDATGTAMRNTPFGVMSEFDLHAHAMNTILSGSFITRLTKRGGTVYILVTCLGLAMVLLWLDQREVRRRYILASSLFFCVHVIVSIIAFVKFGFWLNWLSPAIALALCGVAAKMASSHLELKATYEELRETQSQLIQAETEAERQAIVDRISRTIFHDVKNRINAMHLSLQNAHRILSTGGSRSDGYEQAIEKIGRSISLNEKIMPIMKNTLDFFNIKLDQRMNPAAIVRNACKSMEDELEESGVNLIVHGDGRFPDINLNEERLFLAFQNLMKNACEAMPQGGNLEVKMGFSYEQNQIVIEISDTGIGIPETEFSRIFDWLYTTKTGGQGIGLAIAKINIEAHRGRIDVRSKVGEGTTFTVILPAV